MFLGTQPCQNPFVTFLKKGCLKGSKLFQVGTMSIRFEHIPLHTRYGMPGSKEDETKVVAIVT